MIEDLIQNTIQLNENKTKLLKEYLESIKYEKCTYHLVHDKECKYRNIFYLIDIKTNNILQDGRLGRIKSYINLRKIDIDSIYNNDILKVEEVEEVTEN